MLATLLELLNLLEYFGMKQFWKNVLYNETTTQLIFATMEYILLNFRA